MNLSLLSSEWGTLRVQRWKHFLFFPCSGTFVRSIDYHGKHLPLPGFWENTLSWSLLDLQSAVSTCSCGLLVWWMHVWERILYLEQNAIWSLQDYVESRVPTRSNNNVNETNGWGEISGECQSWGEMSEKGVMFPYRRSLRWHWHLKQLAKGRFSCNNVPFKSDPM